MTRVKDSSGHWRKWGVSLLLWIALFEIGAWIADSRLHFRYTLIDALQTAEATSEPPLRTPLDWERGQLRVRTPDQYGMREEAYIIGGREIEGAWPDGKQEFISTSDVDDDERARVFVLGGSAAFGYPYPYEASLAVQLEKARPHLNVMNVGQVGWASGHVLAAANRVLESWNPQALVVYSGNNEWIQWTPRPEVWQGGIKAQRFLAGSRLLAGALWLGHRWRHPSDTRASRASPLIGFEHTLVNPARELSIDRWQREKELFLRVFQENLSEIHRLAKGRGVRVIFLTVPFNYRLSPSWKHRQPDAFVRENADVVRGAIKRAAVAVGAERCDEALPILDDAIALDPNPAVLHYLRAQCLEQQDRLIDAEQAYARSREVMVGNLGSRLSVNEAIRNVADIGGAEFLDVRSVFDDFEHHRGRHFNEELIHDDCHPTPMGHQLIAEKLSELFPPPPPEEALDSEADHE